MGARADKNALDTGCPKIVALIGTAGVGKTTTIAKLAAVQHSRRKKQTAVISIDHFGIAANAQLKTYARIIGIPLETAVNPNELKRAVKQYRHKDLIIIDTPGVNPTDQIQIRELNSFFVKLPELQKHLVASVTTKDKDLIELSPILKEIGVQRLLFTKIDESSTFGNMLNMLIRTQIPLSFLSSGRKVPDDLELGSIAKLVDLIFQIKNQDRIGSIDPSLLKGSGSEDIQGSIINRSYFVANKNSDVYHCIDCKWSEKIKSENIIQFASNHEAEAQNFLPCRSCNPDRLSNDGTRDSRTATQKISRYQ